MSKGSMTQSSTPTSPPLTTHTGRARRRVTTTTAARTSRWSTLTRTRRAATLTRRRRKVGGRMRASVPWLARSLPFFHRAPSCFTLPPPTPPPPGPQAWTGTSWRRRLRGRTRRTTTRRTRTTNGLARGRARAALRQAPSVGVTDVLRVCWGNCSPVGKYGPLPPHPTLVFSGEYHVHT